MRRVAALLVAAATTVAADDFERVNAMYKYDHETWDEAADRKARERSEVEADMLEMHTWCGGARASRAPAQRKDDAARPWRRFCGQEENEDLYLCEAFRDYQAGLPEEEMAKKRPKDNPAGHHMDWMHARPRRLCFTSRRPDAPPPHPPQTSFCAISDNVGKQPCKMFKPKRNHADYL